MNVKPFETNINTTSVNIAQNLNAGHILKNNSQIRMNYALYLIWQYGLWSFQAGYIKLERFLPKNQRTQRKFLNFDNWTNGEPQ